MISSFIPITRRNPVKAVFLGLIVFASTGASAQVPRFVGPTPNQIVQRSVNWSTFMQGIHSSQVANRLLNQDPDANYPEEAPSPTSFEWTEPSVLVSELAAAQPDPEVASRTNDEFLDRYRRTARIDGFPAADVAYAFTYVTIYAWLSYHQLEYQKRLLSIEDPLERVQYMANHPEPSVTYADEEAVYEDFLRALSADPTVTEASDRERQATTEGLAISLGHAAVAFDAAYNRWDPDAMDAGMAAARSMFKALTGGDVADAKIGPSGLVLP